VLPYLKELSKNGFQFTILSFEKKDRYKNENSIVKNITDAAHIRWIPVWFTSKPPVLSKMLDRWKLKRAALKIFKQEKFDMVHCRSYVAAEAGLELKKKFKTKFLFDMRGFWPDEKKDGGSWNQANPFFRQLYKYYKRKEIQYLQNADQIIVLTEAAKREILKWPGYNPKVPLKVIPCCTDMCLFSLADREQKLKARESLGLSADSLVISYLGSVGSWYMLDQMLIFFEKLKINFPSAKFLFITHTVRCVIDQKIKELNFDKNDFIITRATRKEVPFVVKASDINIFFIKPVYSKISSSPTKLGEVLAMGIPIICNKGVGDVDSIVRNADAGFVLNKFSDANYEEAIRHIPALLKKSPSDIRNAIKDIYSLEKGAQLYLSCYREILSQQ